MYIKSDFFFFFGKSVLTQFFKVLWDACVIAFNNIICLPVFVLTRGLHKFLLVADLVL